MTVLEKIGVVCLGVGIAVSVLADNGKPLPSHHEESVNVQLVQVEITATPREKTASCEALRKEDLELMVGGQARKIVALDPLGDYGVPVSSETRDDSALERSRPAGQFVFYFDEWHIRNICCPGPGPSLRRYQARSMLFEWARDFVRHHLHPGDRVMIATFTGWPTIKTGWLEDHEAILNALDELEVDPAVLTASNGHNQLDGVVKENENSWWEGLRAIVTTLGHTPGSKYLFRMADMDPRDDWPPKELSKLSGRLLAARVTIYAANPFSECLSPGHLSTLALNGGGFEFARPTHAARKLETILRCRYLLSFRPDQRDARHGHQFRISSRNRRFRIATVGNYQEREEIPTNEEQRHALFLLPRWSKTLKVEGGLWSLRPSGRKTWRSLALVKVRIDPDVPSDDAAEEIALDVAVWKGPRMIAERHHVISRRELTGAADADYSKTLAFPLELAPGEYNLAIVASGTASDAAAVLRTTSTIPDPPGPGESSSWLLIDRVARIGENLVPTPSLTGRLPSGATALFLGYACFSDKEQAGDPLFGQLAKVDGDGPTVPVPMRQLDGPSASGDCAWLLGAPEAALSPGVWRFLPPDDLSRGENEEDFSVVFRIDSDRRDPVAPRPSPPSASGIR